MVSISYVELTFADTTLERNALMRNVYPRLKDFCREKHGLEFQVSSNVTS